MSRETMENQGEENGSDFKLTTKKMKRQTILRLIVN